jgi:hypothetical protein
MKTKTQTNASLRNEGNFTKPANLPSGTFSRDGQPTVVTEIVATIVAREILSVGLSGFYFIVDWLNAILQRYSCVDNNLRWSFAFLWF